MCLFQTRQRPGSCPKKTKWPSSNVTSAAKPYNSPRQSKFLSSLLPQPFVHPALWHSHTVFYLCLCPSSPRTPTHPRTLVSQHDGVEEGTGSAVKPVGFKSWLEILAWPWTCYLNILCLHGISLKWVQEYLSPRVVVRIKWTNKYKALPTMPDTHQELDQC